ncbi:hypothetical protein B0H11DRAFT_1899136 [Mycena galericulata]|nr:hypothetical protein B0H11DRAFT_1933934 [Mycena galericulata]KAJ7511568.1 hypothetical protein B0H11DRAFT_1899136 [Mycena galericulata]
MRRRRLPDKSAPIRRVAIHPPPHPAHQKSCLLLARPAVGLMWAWHAFAGVYCSSSSPFLVSRSSLSHPPAYRSWPTTPRRAPSRPPLRAVPPPSRLPPPPSRPPLHAIPPTVARRTATVPPTASHCPAHRCALYRCHRSAHRFTRPAHRCAPYRRPRPPIAAAVRRAPVPPIAARRTAAAVPPTASHCPAHRALYRHHRSAYRFTPSRPSLRAVPPPPSRLPRHTVPPIAARRTAAPVPPTASHRPAHRCAPYRRPRPAYCFTPSRPLLCAVAPPFCLQHHAVPHNAARHTDVPLTARSPRTPRLPLLARLFCMNIVGVM